MRRWTSRAMILFGVGTAVCVGLPAWVGAQAETSGVERADLGVPELHHAHLNSIDPEAALDWYEDLWPAGRRGVVAGHPAFIADMALLFTRVDEPPRGAWDPALQGAAPQSPFWHIGAFTNTTGRFAELERRGYQVLPLFVGPNDRTGVHRSGLTPYSGIRTLEQLREAEPADPRDGGFGYLLGPDGALFELTGGPNTTASFSHVHLFHEEPRCAANWYVDVLMMSLPPRRDRATGETIAQDRWDPCAAERGSAGWPSLESAGTIRVPSGRVAHGNGSLSFYSRQCVDRRCGDDRPLVSSRGQVLDHVGFRVESLDRWVVHLKQRGVRLIEGPYPFGSGRGLLLEGPDGLAIELVELPD